MQTETPILQAIRLYLGGRDGVRIFRNNVGRIEDRAGRWHVLGLCPGSSDLIGWKRITVTPGDVGRELAAFVAIEVKTPRGVRSPAQSIFIDAVRNDGGFAGFATSVSDALRIIA